MKVVALLKVEENEIENEAIVKESGSRLKNEEQMASLEIDAVKMIAERP